MVSNSNTLIDIQLGISYAPRHVFRCHSFCCFLYCTTVNVVGCTWNNRWWTPEHIIACYFLSSSHSPSHCAQLSQKILTLHLIKPDLCPPCRRKKSKHATIVCSCSNIVTCDLWRGTKSACNERQRHKDRENRELISAACPHLSTQTHRIVFAVHSVVSEKYPHMEKVYTHKLWLLWPLRHPHSCKTNMTIRISRRRTICMLKKHSMVFKHNSYQRKTGRMNSLSSEGTKLLLFLCLPSFVAPWQGVQSNLFIPMPTLSFGSFEQTHKWRSNRESIILCNPLWDLSPVTLTLNTWNCTQTRSEGIIWSNIQLICEIRKWNWPWWLHVGTVS